MGEKFKEQVLAGQCKDGAKQSEINK